MTDRLCKRWPQCDCVLQGYVNFDAPHDCGKRPTEEQGERWKSQGPREVRDIVDQIWDAFP